MTYYMHESAFSTLPACGLRGLWVKADPLVIFSASSLFVGPFLASFLAQITFYRQVIRRTRTLRMGCLLNLVPLKVPSSWGLREFFLASLLIRDIDIYVYIFMDTFIDSQTLYASVKLLLWQSPLLKVKSNRIDVIVFTLVFKPYI